MKKKMTAVLVIMMALTACSIFTDKGTESETKTKIDYQFTGESEHWEAVYSYKATEIWGKKGRQATHSSKDNYVLTLKYKGSLEELSSMKHLEYSYETSSSKGSKREDYPAPPSEKVFTTSGSSVNGAMKNKDEMIKIHVKWDDNDESFELRNKTK
ncbi:hypothetical protein [Peribacillus simplex]|uniref:hypothetical protein n=1 Tax=Peribacillus simplex TaxID=1478 RepID=UPI000B0F33F0|nr:hypothetical protein [Peribacillus simplex]